MLPTSVRVIAWRTNMPAIARRSASDSSRCGRARRMLAAIASGSAIAALARPPSSSSSGARFDSVRCSMSSFSCSRASSCCRRESPSSARRADRVRLDSCSVDESRRVARPSGDCPSWGWLSASASGILLVVVLFKTDASRASGDADADANARRRPTSPLRYVRFVYLSMLSSYVIANVSSDAPSVTVRLCDSPGVRCDGYPGSTSVLIRGISRLS